MDGVTAKLDAYGLSVARHQASFSKDPGTQVGACIIRPDGSVASVGRNGFARGVTDSADRLADRPVKLALTIHAELNAILFAREPLAGFTIYTWPFRPCSHCASVIAQSGIARAVAPADAPDRWAASFALAAEVFAETGVVLDLIASQG